MSRIEYLEATSQVIICAFDVPTCTKYGFIVVNDKTVEAVGNRKAFKPRIVFRFLEDTINRNRDDWDIMLGRMCLGKGVERMQKLRALLEEMRGVDPSPIKFGIISKKKGPGEHEYMPGIRLIVLVGRVGGDKWPFIRDDKIFIRPKLKTGAGHFPQGYSTHGGIGTKTKTAKVDKKEKPELYMVPDKVDRPSRKKRHRKPDRDVLKYFSRDRTRLGWQPVLKAMYKKSRYLDLKYLVHYKGRHNKKARVYLKGNEFLADSLGVSERTVNRALAWLKLNDVIYLRKRGYPGEGNSIWELPFNLKHVKDVKRKHKS